ncbi:UNVERIFIED_CONTAM: Pleckstrin homology domain-containing family B member 2 [Trichonephila clavipes]
MDNSVIAKSGWLSRQTSILKKWKKNWVELYRDGHLKYYENECSPNAEDIIFMPTECLAIKAGLQVINMIIYKF